MTRVVNLVSFRIFFCLFFVSEEGMNPLEISELMKDSVSDPSDLEFIGFPDSSRGWYVNGKGPETRAESEARAAKFYLWLCEYLDKELKSAQADVYDAGVSVPGEENECEQDRRSPRRRRRRTELLVGHGDFMGLVLKRIVAGFGHYVENEGIPHSKFNRHKFLPRSCDLSYLPQRLLLSICII